MGKAIAVIGGGSWGTALIKILSNNTDDIIWWHHKRNAVDYIIRNKHNPTYLSDVEIDLKKVKPVDSIEEAFEKCTIIILAVPSAFLKNVLSPLNESDFRNKLVCSAIKGIVPENLLIVGEYLNQIYKISYRNIGVITGPCHAEEVALEKLSYLTVACKESANAVTIASLLNCRYIKTTVSDDIFGTEYTAVIKNIIAIASGICHSLGYGDNFQAVLISNAIQEIKRFIDAVSPIDRDINDSSYLGDLLVTAYSQFSRNRTFGSMIGKGYSVKSAQMEMNMIAEGYNSVKCIYELNDRYKVDLPVCNAVFNILYSHASPATEMNLLANRLK